MAIHVTLAKTEEEKSMFAATALSERLYERGWMLQRELCCIQQCETVKFVEICLAKKEDEVVGVALYFTPETGNHPEATYEEHAVVCYVRPSHRREGIGTKLINGFGVDPSIMKSYRGNDISPLFWAAAKTNYQGWF